MGTLTALLIGCMVAWGTQTWLGLPASVFPLLFAWLGGLRIWLLLPLMGAMQCIVVSE